MFVALEALNILAEDDLGRLGHNSADYLHLVLEALAIAFADRNAYLADPAAVPDATLRGLLSREYARDRRRDIQGGRAGMYRAGRVGRYAGRGPARLALERARAIRCVWRPPTTGATWSR